MGPADRRRRPERAPPPGAAASPRDRHVDLVAVVQHGRQVQLLVGRGARRRADRTRRRPRPRRRPAIPPAAGTRPARLTAPPTSTTSSPGDGRRPGRPVAGARGLRDGVPPSTSIDRIGARHQQEGRRADDDRDRPPPPMATHGVARGGGSASAGAASAASSARHGAPDGSTGEQLPGGPRRAGGGPSTPLGALPTGSTSATNATRRDLSGAYLTRGPNRARHRMGR